MIMACVGPPFAMSGGFDDAYFSVDRVFTQVGIVFTQFQFTGSVSAFVDVVAGYAAYAFPGLLCAFQDD